MLHLRWHLEEVHFAEKIVVVQRLAVVVQKLALVGVVGGPWAFLVT